MSDRERCPELRFYLGQRVWFRIGETSGFVTAISWRDWGVLYEVSRPDRSSWHSACELSDSKVFDIGDTAHDAS